MSERKFTARDDGFHFAEMGDDWWATETAWFSFHHPERRLGGWFYTMARPNIGTIAGGAWIWDDGAHLPWEALYSANYSALPIPTDQDFTDITLPTGVSVKALEPCMSYALGYDDGERLQADLRFDGVMPPEALTAAGSTFGSAHHFDQFGRVSGEIVLHGERIGIDCLAMRDRTWGRRPENRPRQAAYITGMADPSTGFLAVTNVRPEGDHVAYGFLRTAGRNIGLAGGERKVERDPDTGITRRIELRLEDQQGREVMAIGEPVSSIVINRHTFIDINSLVRWDLDGETAWGEEQDMWPMHRFSAMRRAGRG
ncbi:MAG: hypothetical protein QF384_20145 [Alphaproteobacteria bacterium]|jgi:hypothetical protein|nr:hypothetical protein [Alphaproteobacteria bacterium]MDP6832099.1 hypothetical protein [Alphaproteobacteria bacterium]